MTASPETLPAKWELRGRGIVAVLLVLGIVGTILLGAVFKPPGPEGSAVTLELAADSEAFEAALSEGWRQDQAKLCGSGAQYDPNGSGLGTLKCHLLLDSVLFVPAYAGLLIYFTMALSRIGPGRRDIVAHLACVPAVAAGLFDIAENGMAVLAAVDFMDGFLTDVTVADVRVASLAKWSLVALAFAVLLAMTLGAVDAVRKAGGAIRLLYVAAAAAALCALIVGAGVAWSKYMLLAPGMLPGIITLALLSWWRFMRFPEIASRLASRDAGRS
jgi:hypothetical protein